MKPIKLYWTRGEKDGGKNFGDWLSPKLCEAISGKSVQYAPAKKCDMIAIGSILQRLRNHFWSHKVHVWGTGFIEEKGKCRLPHYVHAVRGQLTAATISNKSNLTLGDPGLLCGILLPDRKIEKKFSVGIIPHYVDYTNPIVIEFCKQANTTLIDVFSDTTDFITQVAQCEVILSSSLHGLITADALDIPNAWIKLSDKVRGNDFKFADYYSIFDLNSLQPFPLLADTKISALTTIRDSYHRPSIEQIKKDLYDSFPFK